MPLLCQNKLIQLFLDEKNSMLITGGSRMGKTVLASMLAEWLIHKGYQIHLIDLGEKWSSENKKPLYDAGVITQQVEKQGILLNFVSEAELLGCVRHILNAVGISSYEAATALKKAFLFQLRRKRSFNFKEILIALKIIKVSDETGWAGKIQDRFECCGEMPDICFRVEKKGIFTNTSAIWELSGIEDFYIQMAAYLICYCLFCRQRRNFKEGIGKTNTIIIIDEFQNLDCDRRSVIGMCLTEGQKYGLSLMLITQFLQGNFSDAVLNQFKQGGFRFHFRLMEEEAAIVSRQLCYNYETRKELFRKLVALPRGQCLMMGPHTVGKSNRVSESFRFVEVEQNMVEDDVACEKVKKDKGVQKKKIIAMYSKGEKLDMNLRKGREKSKNG